MPAEDVTITAKWTINSYNATFDAAGGVFADGKGTATTSSDYGTAIKLPDEPTKTGYTFAGWTLQNNVVDFAQFTVPANDVTLKATWTAKTYKASFYANKGDAEAYSVVDIKYNARLNCAAPEAPSANLYFDGWYNAETDEAASANAGTALGNYLIDGDSAYYAKWTEYPHKIIIKAKNFSYDLMSVKALTDLKKLVELEGFKEIVKEEIESLEKKLQTNLDHSLEHFSKDVKTLIADEIVRRYYGDKGGIIYNLREDTDILESYKILGDKEKYNEILTPKAKDAKETKE